MVDKLKPLSIEYLIEQMENNKPFTLSRHKDGEFFAIFEHLKLFKRRTQNCDKHLYYDSMGEALLSTLTEPVLNDTFIYGMQPHVLNTIHDEVNFLFDKYNINLDWYDSDLLHNAIIAGTFYPFLAQLKKMRVVIIAPERVQPIEKHLGEVHFVDVPLEVCWLERERITEDILKIAEDNTIYLFSSSMPTPVFIRGLYNQIGKKSWMIDFGSIWECLLGTNIRNYQRKMSPETRKKNLYGTVLG